MKKKDERGKNASPPTFDLRLVTFIGATLKMEKPDDRQLNHR